ncbi:MAG: helix-turn-helix transcriptional regulator [Muribaculum sp.]|nr:helix-turn-helix transcriptional regulator [Muribaculaceae bacterium]MCM1080357.1 helix-turn-helix transcriptional regulator [Muribaculum sp.]
MSLVKPETLLCAVIDSEPSVIPVVNRFDIRLGTGEASVEQICKAKGITPEFFLAIVNTFINESYFPEDKLRNLSPVDIVDYLKKTNSYYSQFQLSNIERHFRLLLPSVGSGSNICWLLDFFHELRDSLLRRIQSDEDLVFASLSQNIALPGLKEYVETMDEIDTGIADRLSDLKNMFVKHLKGACDNNLLYAVIVAIITLEKDIRQNNRIRSRLLKPLLLHVL